MVPNVPAAALTRSPLRRGPWRRKKAHAGVARLADTPKLPKDWTVRRDYILWRDDRHCRYCGEFAGASATVDHIVPRQVAPDSLRDEHTNLATLCARHAGCKVEVERALFAGDAYPLRRWLRVLCFTGPVPSEAQCEAAWTRVRAWLR